MKKKFYTLLVEAIENNDAFVQVYWAFATHMGEAIDRVLMFAKQIGIEGARVGEIDFFNFDDLPDDVVKTNNEIYYAKARHYFPIDEYSTFELPYGVVLSTIEGDLEIDDIKEGYTKYNDGDFEHLEVVVDRSKLFDLFFSIVEQMTTIKVIWIKLASDWESEGVAEFYANEALDNFSDIKNFININYNDLYLNGHLTITIYSDIGATNLNLDDHKKIHVITQSSEFIDNVCKNLSNKGYSRYENNEFNSIDFGFYHWHNRHSSSKNRVDLINFLKENGFYLWRTE